MINEANSYHYDKYSMIPLFTLPKLYAVADRVDEWPIIKGILEINNLEYLTLK